MRCATCNKPSRCSTLLSGESTTIALHFSKNATKCRPARPARLPKKQRRKEQSQKQRRGQPPEFWREKGKNENLNLSNNLLIFWSLLWRTRQKENNGEWKEKKYLNIWYAEEKNNRDWKRGKYLEKENICSTDEKKNREGKAENYLKRENIWFAEDKTNGDGTRGKYLEKANIC